MKLSQFPVIAQAILQVSKENTMTHGNGTTGNEYFLHYWGSEEQFDAEKEKWITAKATAVLKGDSEGYKLAEAELGRLSKDVKYTLIFKLMEKISTLKGTKAAFDGQNKYQPVMHDVEFVYIQQDTMDLIDVDLENTGDKAMDNQGNEVDILKLTLKEGILDVKEGKLGYNNQIIRPSRAYIYAVSARSMQIAGSIMAAETKRKRNLFSMEESK